MSQKPKQFPKPALQSTQAGKRPTRSKPPENQAGKFERVVRLMILLKANTYMSMDDMVRELAVDKRTVRRYLQALESGGVPTIFDPARCAYRIEKSHLLNMPRLRVDEALAVVAALSVVKKTPCLEAGQQALAKILGALPGSIRKEIGEIESGPYIRPSPGSQPGTEDHNYSVIKEAIRSTTQLTAEYQSVSRGTHEKVLLDPYELFFQHRAWYVVGKARTTVLAKKPINQPGANPDETLAARRTEAAPQNPTKNASADNPPAINPKPTVRIFKLVRLSKLINTQKPFLKPKSFTLDEHLDLAWNMAPGEERYRVRIKFDAHVSALVSETFWHKTQIITPHEDGGLLFEATVDGLNEIIWWVLSFGSHAKVEGPNQLEVMVQAELKNLAL